MTTSALRLTPDQRDLRAAVRELCESFPQSYWRELDAERGYPERFVRTLTESGYLAALIPEEYGGAGLGITEASIILEEVNRAGGNAAACHAQMYIMGTVLRHGSPEQKRRYLPDIAGGRLRLQAFGVTEPTAGSDTTNIQTMAVRRGDRYVVNGQKVWTSRVQHSDMMLLLARTSPPGSGGSDKTFGLSTFLVDLRTAPPGSVEVRPIRTMMNHETNEVFIRDLEVPAENLIGEEGKGFRYVLDGMNAERILIAAECIGDGRFFVDRAVKYASERVVFGRPIAQNQGVQFPIARAHAALEAADLMRLQAAALFDGGEKCGAEANLAKLLASEASWQAANASIDAHGGYGFAEEYDVERKFRETRLYITAPVANNLILTYIGQHVLGMPRSY
ncbi:MAG TPA: acyl-CoA dehydrogenase family protein [Candidatus Dormibacteraeota bacterium]|nr:acyl-CoA dehydrogenase family protein [Candidatus Dormibacteraeota bacterium]